MHFYRDYVTFRINCSFIPKYIDYSQTPNVILLYLYPRLYQVYKRNSKILRGSVPNPTQHRCQRLLSSRSKSKKPSKKRSETIMSNESLKIVLARGRSTGPKGSLVDRGREARPTGSPRSRGKLFSNDADAALRITALTVTISR